MGRIQSPIQLVIQRKAMVGIKQRAEGTWSPSPLDVVEPLLWLLAASVRVLVQRDPWWMACFSWRHRQPSATAAAAAAAAGGRRRR